MKNRASTVVAVLAVLALPHITKAQDEAANGGAPPRTTAALLVDSIKPRTRLEATLLRKGAVIVKGYTEIRTIPGAQQCSIRILAVELTDSARGTRDCGIAIEVRQAGANYGAISYVDYNEIDSLISALESLQKLDLSVTRFAGVDASFRTAGDLEVQNVEQNGARVATIQAVQLRPPSADLVWATAYFDVNQLSDIAEQVQIAKQTIDSSRATRDNK
jgi:hypothetical protein